MGRSPKLDCDASSYRATKKNTIFPLLIRLANQVSAMTAIDRPRPTDLGSFPRAEQGRLRSFIRRRVADTGDAEDILQDVFYELVEAYRARWCPWNTPARGCSAWPETRSSIFSGKTTGEAFAERAGERGRRAVVAMEDLLPSPDAGPEAAYTREVLLEELEAGAGGASGRPA